MIIMGPKKDTASIILGKMEGKGASIDDLKFDPEKQSKSEESDSTEKAKMVMEALKADDSEKFESALKEFIMCCMNK